MQVFEMKCSNHIVADRFSAVARWLLLGGILALGACAPLQVEKVEPPALRNVDTVVQVDDIDLLALSPAMEDFLQRYILDYGNRQTRLELLTLAVTSSGVLSFKYDDRRTLTAAEAFEARAGNCIGFANMMIALARRAGLKAYYQEVFIRPEWSEYEDDTVLLYKHVNVVIEAPHKAWVVDVSGVKTRPDDRRRIIDDSFAKALYLNNIAVESLLVNDLPTAYAYMRSAIEADPRVTDSWVNLGVVLDRNNQLDDAAFVFRQALNIDPEEHSASSNLYEVYMEQGKLEQARQIEAKVERYRRNNPYYLLRLSDEALLKRDYDESISLLQSAISKKADDYKLHFALARTQYLSGKLGAAEESLVRVRELAPKDMVAYYSRPLDELVEQQ